MAELRPRILLATNNPGKVRQISALLAPHGWTVLTPAELDLQLDPEETGETYAENAATKAHAFADAAGMAVIADDSGLEVDALQGRPGLRSARYGGAGLAFDERINLLLGELQGVPEQERGARFRSVIAVAVPDGRAWQTEGTLEGRISFAPRGTSGMGYDPIFLIDGRDVTMAEIGDDERNRISHRALAMVQAVALLERLRADPAFQ